MPKSRNRKNHKNRVKAYHDKQKHRANKAREEFNEILKKYQEENEQTESE